MNKLESVFPHEGRKGDSLEVLPSSGITMRDWIAVRCLQGILSNPEFNKESHSDAAGPAKVADMSYRFADALLLKSADG